MVDFLKVLLALYIGAYIGRLMSLIIYYLPMFLLDESSIHQSELREILKRFFQRPFCLSCKRPFSSWKDYPIINFLSSGGYCPGCKCSLLRNFGLELCVALLFATLAFFSTAPSSLFFVFLAICLLICCFFYRL